MPAMSLMTDVVYAVGSVLSLPVWGARMLRTGKWRTDWKARFGRCRIHPDERRTLLIHAVSVGEVNAVRRLVDELEQRHGQSLRIVISATTDTGFSRARELYAQRHDVVRYPLDFTFAVRRFLHAVRPDVVALTELEVWPTFVSECVRRQVPVAVVNGRLSERSYRRYRRIVPLVRRTFSKLAAVGAQDASYARRFVELGAQRPRVRVTGNMKWDTARIEDHVSGSQELAVAMGIDRERPLIVCGSTGDGEEQLLTRTFVDAVWPDAKGIPQPVQLLIAPRKPERFDHACRAMERVYMDSEEGRKSVGAGQAGTAEQGGAGEREQREEVVVRRTRHPDGTQRPYDEQRLFLLDTLGELRRAYALADVVIVGRSFNHQHGSDMIEPIALGKPVIVGPRTDDFTQIMDKLRTGGGIIQLPDAGRLRGEAAALLDPPRARALVSCGRRVILDQQGATARNAQLIQSLLRPAAPQPSSASLPPRRGRAV